MFFLKDISQILHLVHGTVSVTVTGGPFWTVPLHHKFDRRDHRERKKEKRCSKPYSWAGDGSVFHLPPLQNRWTVTFNKCIKAKKIDKPCSSFTVVQILFQRPILMRNLVLYLLWPIYCSSAQSWWETLFFIYCCPNIVSAPYHDEEPCSLFTVVPILFQRPILMRNHVA